MYMKTHKARSLLALLLAFVFAISNFPLHLSEEVPAAEGSGGSSSSAGGGGSVPGGSSGAVPHANGIAYNSVLYLYPCIQKREQYTAFGVEGAPFIAKTRGVWPVSWDTNANAPIGTFFVVEDRNNVNDMKNPKTHATLQHFYGAWNNGIHAGNGNKIYFNGQGSNAESGDRNYATKNAISDILYCSTWNAGDSTKSADNGGVLRISIAKDLSTDALLMTGNKYGAWGADPWIADLSANGAYSLPKTKAKLEYLQNFSAATPGIRFWAEISADNFVKFGKDPSTIDAAYRSAIVENAVANAYLVQAYYVASGGKTAIADLDDCLVDCLNYWTGATSEYEYIPIFEQAIGANIGPWANHMYYMPVHDWMGLATSTSSMSGTMEPYKSKNWLHKGQIGWTPSSQPVSRPQSDDPVTITKFAWWTLMRYCFPPEYPGSKLAAGNGITFRFVSLYRKGESGEGYAIPEIPKATSDGNALLGSDAIIGFGTLAAPPGNGSPPPDEKPASGEHRLIAAFETGTGGSGLSGVSSNYDWQGSPMKATKVKLGETSKPAGTNIEFSINTADDNLQGMAQKILASSDVPEPPGEDDTPKNLYLNYAKITLEKEETSPAAGESNQQAQKLDASAGSLTTSGSKYSLDTTYYPLFIKAASTGSFGGTATVPTEKVDLVLSDRYAEEGMKSCALVKIPSTSYYYEEMYRKTNNNPPTWSSTYTWTKWEPKADFYAYVELEAEMGNYPDVIVKKVTPVKAISVSSLSDQIQKGRVTLEEITSGDVKDFCNKLNSLIGNDYRYSGGSISYKRSGSNEWTDYDAADNKYKNKLVFTASLDSNTLPSTSAGPNIIGDPRAEDDVFTGGTSATFYAPDGQSAGASVGAYSRAGALTINTQAPLCSSSATVQVSQPKINNKTGAIEIEQSKASSDVPMILANINTGTTEGQIVNALKLYTQKYLVKNAPMVMNYADFNEVGAYIWNYKSTMSLVFTIGESPGDKVSSSVSNAIEIDFGSSEDSVALTVAAEPIIAEWHNEPVAFAEIKQGDWSANRASETYEAMQGVPTFLDKGRTDSNPGDATGFYVNVGGTPLFIGVEAEMNSVSATRQWTFLSQYRQHSHSCSEEDGCKCKSSTYDGPVDTVNATFSGSYWSLRHLVIKNPQQAVITGYNIVHRDSGDGVAFYAPVFEPDGSHSGGQAITQESSEGSDLVIDFQTVSGSSSGSLYDSMSDHDIKPTVEEISYKFNGHDVNVKVEYVHFNNVVSSAANPYTMGSSSDAVDEKGEPVKSGSSGRETAVSTKTGTDFLSSNKDSDAFGVSLASGTFRGSAKYHNATGALNDIKYKTLQDAWAFINSDSCVVTVVIDNDDAHKQVYPILKGFSYQVPILYKSTLKEVHPSDHCGHDKVKLNGSIRLYTSFTESPVGNKVNQDRVQSNNIWFPSSVKKEHHDDGTNLYDWPIWDRQYAIPTVGYNGHPDYDDARNNSYDACEADGGLFFDLVRYEKEDEIEGYEPDSDHDGHLGKGQKETNSSLPTVDRSPGSHVKITTHKSKNDVLAGTSHIDLYTGSHKIAEKHTSDVSYIKFKDNRIPNGRYDFLSFDIVSARNGNDAPLYKDGPLKINSDKIAAMSTEALIEDAGDGNLSSGTNIACRISFGEEKAKEVLSDPVSDPYIYEVYYKPLEYLDNRDPIYTKKHEGSNPNLTHSTGWFADYPEWTDVDGEVTGSVDYTRNQYAADGDEVNRVIRQGINPIIVYNPVSVQDTTVSYSTLKDQRVNASNGAYNNGSRQPNFIDTGFTLHIGTGIDFNSLGNLHTKPRTGGLLFSNMYDGGHVAATPAVKGYYASNQPEGVTPLYSYKDRYQSDRSNYVYGDNYGIIGKGYTSSLSGGITKAAEVYTAPNLTGDWKDGTGGTSGTGTSHYIANIIIEVPINVIFDSANADIKAGSAKLEKGTYVPAGTLLTIEKPELGNYSLHFVVSPDQKDCKAATFNVVAQAYNDPGNAIGTPYMERYSAVKGAKQICNLDASFMSDLLEKNNTSARQGMLESFAYRTGKPDGSTQSQIYSKHMQYEANLVRAGMNTAAHWATKTMSFDVVGRIGNITVDDVEDPNFQGYFREDNGKKFVTTHNSIFDVWNSGDINQTITLGKYHDQKQTTNYLPISNAESKDKISYPKLGYEFNYSVQTIGSYGTKNMTIIPQYSIDGKEVSQIFYNTGNNSYTSCYKPGDVNNTYHIFKDYGSVRSKINLREQKDAKISEVLKSFAVQEDDALTAERTDQTPNTNRIVNIGTLAQITLYSDYNKYADGNTHIIPTTSDGATKIQKYLDTVEDDHAVKGAGEWPVDKITVSGITDVEGYKEMYKNSGNNHNRWTGALKLPSSSIFYDNTGNRIKLVNDKTNFSKLLIGFDIKTDIADPNHNATDAKSPDWKLSATTDTQITDKTPAPPPPGGGGGGGGGDDETSYEPEVRLIEGHPGSSIKPSGTAKKPVPIILFDVTQTSATDLSITGTH